MGTPPITITHTLYLARRGAFAADNDHELCLDEPTFRGDVTDASRPILNPQTFSERLSDWLVRRLLGRTLTPGEVCEVQITLRPHPQVRRSAHGNPR